MRTSIAILGIGNILEYDDGIAVYAATYLKNNFTFTPCIDIINGDVEGIHLLNIFMEYSVVLILDAIAISDAPGSIYCIPSSELSGYGLNSGGAHEVGVLQCLDILELLDKPLPQSFVIGIVPHTVKMCLGITPTLTDAFDTYIKTILQILQQQYHVTSCAHPDLESLETIIENFKNP